MKCLVTLLLSTLSPLFAISQCYEIQQRPYYPDPYGGGFSVGQLYDDNHSDTIDIGFPFCFFGDTVTQAVVSSNGYITFDLSMANSYSPYLIDDSIPNPNLPLFSIMAPWQDMNPGMGGEITYETFGVPPYRRFVVSYDSIFMYSCNSIPFTYQVALYESTNFIDINIEDKPICTVWNGGAAIEGIHNHDGTEAYVVPGRNYPDQWTAQNDSYRFTPICECSTVTSVIDSESTPISIFPNPTTGELFFSNTDQSNLIRSVTVLDTQGRILLSRSELGISKIDLDELSSGIYLVRIKTENRLETRRVVKH